MLLRLTVVGSLLITLSPVASAQSDPALLPTPLISALMAGDQYGSSRSGRFFVEATPTGWPADLVPASPATVLGGMSTGSQLISVFADTTKRFLANYLKSLADAGWSQPVIDRGGGFQSTGFAGSTATFAEIRPECRPLRCRVH